MKKSDVYRVLNHDIEVAEWWMEKLDFEECNRWVVKSYKLMDRFGIESNRLTKKYFDRLSALDIILEKAGF